MTQYQVRARSIDGTVWAMQSPQMWSSERSDAFIFTNDGAQARVMNQRQINDQVEPDAQIGQLTIIKAI